MAGTFPALKAGTITVHPAERTTGLRTRVLEFLNGQEQRFVTTPKLYRWRIRIEGMTASERAQVVAFHAAQRGAMDSTWTLDLGGKRYQGMVFDEDILAYREVLPEQWECEFIARQTLLSTMSRAVPAASSNTFPLLSTGARAQRPIEVRRIFYTEKGEATDGSYFSRALIDTPRVGWDLTYPAITHAEAQTLETFFSEHRGPWHPFQFTCPVEGILYDQVRFANEDLQITWETPAKASVRLQLITVDELPPCDPPEVAVFTVSPATIATPATATLSWQVNGATSVYIDQGIGTVAPAGSIVVNPASPTTYTLTASNDCGSTVAEVTLFVTPCSAPAISFSGPVAEINYGEQAKLAWSVADADSVTIDQGIGAVSAIGSIYVAPTNDTTYTLTAISSCGTSTATVTVQVADPPPPSGTLYHAEDIGGAVAMIGNSGTWVTSTDGTSVTRKPAAPTLLAASDERGIAKIGSSLYALFGRAYSTDGGLTWGVPGSPGLRDLVQVGSTWVAPVRNNYQVGVSADGVAWSYNAYPATYNSRNQTMMLIATNGTRAVLGGFDGVLLHSTDFATWTRVTSVYLADRAIVGLAYGASIFVAIRSYNSVFTSPDGITWTARAGVLTGIIDVVLGLRFVNGRFVAVGKMNNNTATKLASSTDGITWTAHDFSAALGSEVMSQGLRDVAYVNSLYFLVGGYNPPRFLTTADLSTFTLRDPTV